MMNWGTKIAIVYTFFASCLIACVIASTFYDFQLVREDYFESEKEYNQIQAALNRSKALGESVEMKVLKGPQNQLVFEFPQELGEIKVKTHLYRPSNATLDQKLEYVPIQNGIYYVQTDTLAKGFWRIRLMWEAKGENYINDFSTVL